MAESVCVSSPSPSDPRPIDSVPFSLVSLGGKPHFHILGVPVRVTPGFWLMAIVMAGAQQDWRAVLTWGVVVFVSVLVHELGHALAARGFGATPAILLYTLGGVTVYSGKLSRPKSGLISFAGPFAGLALGALVLALDRLGLVGHRPVVKMLVESMLWVNIGWGVINLMPVLPFDGGHILAAVLGPKRLFATSVVSAIVGIAVCVYGWTQRSYFLAILFGTAAFTSIAQVRTAWAHRADSRAGLEAELDEARRLLDAGEPDRALELALDVTRRARTAAVRDAAWTIIAWVHVAQGDGRRAREALAQASSQLVDPYTLAAVEDAAGNRAGAVQVLEVARERGVRTPEATKLLIDLYARGGDWDHAAELAAKDAPLLGTDSSRRVVEALFDATRYRAAALVAEQTLAVSGQADDAIAMARALAKAGDVLGALEALERAVSMVRVEEGAVPGRMALLAADPAFEGIASDERFRRLLG